MKKLLLIVALFALSYADIESDSLALHNNERNAYGVPSVTWSADLASAAQAYAEVMASTGTTSHSTNRVNVGENLAWGTGSVITVTYLGNLWINEKQYYIPGQDFPDVSTTGSWHDVAHYTQLMWEKTTEIGCGIAQASSGRYNYVCHYAPQGNIDGQPVYTVGSTISSSPSTTSSENNEEFAFPTVGNEEDTTTYAPVTTAPATSTSTASTTPSTTTSTSISTSTPATTTTTATASTPATTTTTTTTNQPYTYSTSAPDATTSAFISDSIYAHNNERNNYGVPSLVWNTTLAQTAQTYAEYQASTGTTSHSTGRVNVGENLAWQSGSGTTTQALANRWLAEKRYFIAGQTFPDVSTTGSWESVAHYTQMMWRRTTDVGCGVSESSRGMYYYVCHYYVQGNIDGQSVY